MIDVRILAEPTTDDFSIQLAHAVAAEAAGFSGWFRSEHLIMGEQEVAGTDAMMVLAGLATQTSKLRLGTLMSPATFRLPGQLAVQVAQLDRMSGGRMELGLGTGWFEPEHRAFGIDFGENARARFDRLEEQLQIVTDLWKTVPGERYSHSGRFYELASAPAAPTSQIPHVPLILGGQGPVRTPRLAARFANEFNALRQPPAELVKVFARVRAACEKVGRDPASLVYSTAVVVCCGENRAQIEQRIERSGQPRKKLAAAGAAGTPEQVVEQLAHYIDAGASRLYLRLFDLPDLDHVALLGDQVRARVGH